MKKARFRLFGWAVGIVVLAGFVLSGQTQISLAVGGTGFISSMPHSGGVFDIGIASTSRVSSISEFTIRPITLQQPSFQFTTGMETVVATSGKFEASLLVMGGGQNALSGAAGAFTQDGRVKWFPGWAKAPGVFFSVTAGGVETSTGQADPRISFMIGMTLNGASGGTLSTRRALKTKKP